MFVIEFLLFLTIIFFLLNLIRNNILIWWRVFLFITIIFITLNKSNNSYTSIINYFVIQERLGLLFLVFSTTFLQFFILLIKIGVAPLHFWIFSVSNNLINWGLIWFLTLQKLPFIPVFIQIFFINYIYIFLLGIFLCFFQLFSIKNYKNIIIISSTESFNWIILLLIFSVLNFFYIIIFYLVIIILVINSFYKKDYNFINWERILIFLNIPFSITFFVKIFSLNSVFIYNDFFVLMLLFFIFLSIISFRFWLVNLRTKNFLNTQDNNKIFYFVLVPLIIRVLI